MGGVVGHDAHGPALDAHQGRHHPEAETPSQFKHRALVGQGRDHLTDVVNAQPVLGDQTAQETLVRASPIRSAALKIREVLLGGAHRFFLVLHRDIHHAIGYLDIHGAHFFRAEDAEAAALDHRRPPHADIRVRRGDHHVATAQERGVPRKAAAGVDAHQGHPAREFGKELEGQTVEPRHPAAVRIPGPAAAPLGQEHQGQSVLGRQFKDAILLAVIEEPLGPRQNRVIVRGQHAARIRIGKDRPVDAPHPRHHAVGGGIANQIVDFPPAALGGHHQGGVFDEAVGIAEVVDILPGRALAGLASPGHRFWTPCVEDQVVAFVNLGQVGANRIEIRHLLFPRRRALDLTLGQEDQGVALGHRIPGSNRHAMHFAADGRLDDVFHLHGFHHQQGPAGLDESALAHIHADHGALNRGANCGGTRRNRRRVRNHGGGRWGGGSLGRRCPRLGTAMIEHRQGIRSIDPGTDPG